MRLVVNSMDCERSITSSYSAHAKHSTFRLIRSRVSLILIQVELHTGGSDDRLPVWRTTKRASGVFADLGAASRRRLFGVVEGDQQQQQTES